MSKHGVIRAVIAIIMTVGMLTLAFLTVVSNEYLKALEALIMPFTMVIAGVFGVDTIRNLKKGK